MEKVDTVLGKEQTFSIIGHVFIYTSLRALLFYKEIKPIKEVDWFANLKNNFNHDLIGDIYKWIKTQLNK
jgi:hypothetical protein